MLSNSLSVSNTHEILFCLTRAGLGGVGEWSSGIGKVEWAEVIKLAAVQGVLAIAWDGLQKLIAKGKIPAEQQPSRDQMLRWLANIDSIEKSYARQKAAIRKLASFYDRNGFRMMLLKGYGLSLCYPTPEHRPCGDIDIWLYGRQQEADALLREKHGVKIDEDKHHHTTFTVNGILVENHYDFINVHSHASNVEIERELKRLAVAPESKQIDVEGTPITLPAPDFNALFLLKHMAAHFAAIEIGFRHICDWAVFVRTYGDKVDWDLLKTTATQFNMHRFLGAVNRLCVDRLGIDESMCGGFVGEDRALAERILNDILAPEFGEQQPKGNPVKVVWFKWRRWWANRWKHRLVYRDSLGATFVHQVIAHLRKPKSIWG